MKEISRNFVWIEIKYKGHAQICINVYFSFISVLHKYFLFRYVHCELEFLYLSLKPKTFPYTV